MLAKNIFLFLVSFSIHSMGQETRSLRIKNDFNIVVDKNGTGDFINIQEAINAAKSFPSDRITISIKNGVYYEKVKIHSWNTKISLIG